MEKVEGENRVAEECAGRKYYPVIEEVWVLKSRLINAVYLEIKGLSRSFGNGREREFCTCYMAETPLQMKKLIGKHIGAGMFGQGAVVSCEECG